MEKEKKKGTGIVFDLINAILMVLPFIGFLFPMATYKYHVKMYSLMCDSLLTGKSIGGGSVNLSPNIAIWIWFVLSIITVLGLLILGRKKAKWVAELQAVTNIIGLVAPLVIASKVATTLNGV